MADKAYIKELTERIAENNDEKAAREFFEIFHPKLVRYAMFFTRSISTANDLVSDVFVKLFRKPAHLSNIQEIEYYLYRAVKNQCLTYLKKEKHEVSLEDFEWEDFSYTYESANPENELLTRELSLKIEEVINSFPPKRKMIYKMVAIDGLKYKEAADILGLSVKTIENHLAIAVKDMRIQITSYIKANDIKLPFFMQQK